MSRHLKRYAAPRTWTILRKTTKWVAKPMPGPHLVKEALPLELVLKQLGHAKILREVKKILNTSVVFIDGRAVHDPKFPVGFMDVIDIRPTKQVFRVLFDKKGKLQLREIAAQESATKVCKIIGKQMVKKARTQLNLFDSRNLLVEKDGFSVGDSLVLHVPEQKILDHLKLEKGALIYLIGGKHIGETGAVDEIQGKKLWYKNAQGDRVETLARFAFVIGKEKPVIRL